MTAVAGIAFVLLLIATYLLAFQRYVWDAALLLLLSVVGVSYGIITSRPLAEAFRNRRLTKLIPQSIWGWARLGSLLLSLLVAFSARERLPAVDFTFPVILWLFAVSSFAVTLIVPLARKRLIQLSFTQKEIHTLLALLFVAALVRGVGLGQIPANLGGDEGTQLLRGLQLVDPPLNNPFATGWYSVPTMSFFLYGIAMRLLGATIAGGRALSVIVGVITVFTTFLLGRSLGGRRCGWLAALVVTFSAYHIHFSRLASNQIFDPLFGTLTMWLLWFAIEARPFKLRDMHVLISPDAMSFASWGLAGLVAGLGWYVYFGARWVTFLVVLVIAWRVWVEPSFLRRHKRGLVVFVAGWLVSALPLLGWYSAHPSALTERYSAVSIFASGWLTQAKAATGHSVIHILLQQLWKAGTAFHLTRDPTFWYYPQMPLVDFVTGALLLVGMISAFMHVHRPEKGVTLLWYWSTLVMGWVLTENPPSSQRGLLLVPAVGLLTAWGVDALEHLFDAHRHYVRVVEMVLLCMMVVLNVGFYFAVYTPRRQYGNPTAETATELAHFLTQQPHASCSGATVSCSSIIYFFGPPSLYWDFGTLAFMLREQPGVDIAPDTLPDAVSSPARFVFLPHRFAELDAVLSAYPGGSVFEVRSGDGRVLATVYDWSD